MNLSIGLYDLFSYLLPGVLRKLQGRCEGVKIRYRPREWAVLLAVPGLLAYTWGKRFDEWYYRAIFTQALSYGPGLKEFLANDQVKWQTPVEVDDPHAEEYQ